MDPGSIKIPALEHRVPHYCAADQPSRIMSALWMDRSAGISTGAMFVLGGLTWIAIAWLLAAIAGHLATA
jgi:hypothetical protein